MSCNKFSEANDAIPQLTDSKRTYENTSKFNATCFAKILQKHLDLKQILESWESLPEHIKQAIKALVQANTKGGQP